MSTAEPVSVPSKAIMLKEVLQIGQIKSFPEKHPHIVLGTSVFRNLKHETRSMPVIQLNEQFGS